MNTPLPPELAELIAGEQAAEAGTAAECAAIRAKIGATIGGGAIVSAKLMALILGLAVVGVSTVVVVVRDGTSVAQVAHVDAPVAAIPAPTPDVPVIAPALVEETAPPPEPAAARRRSVASPAAAAPRTSEADLLARATRALAAGDADSTLALVAEHARDYPHGRLAEERDALRIRALAETGRLDDARTEAARFAAAHSDSIYQRAIDRALTSKESP